MIHRFWFFPAFVINTLKKQKHPKVATPASKRFSFSLFLKWMLSGFLPLRIKLIPVAVLSFILLTFLAYRLLSLQQQVVYYEDAANAFHQRLLVKKKDLVFLRSLVQESPPASLEHLLTTAEMNRFDFGDRLKWLARQIGFEDMSFSLMPQKKILLREDLLAFITTISVAYKAPLDQQVWQWIERLSLDLPCFFIPRRLTIERILDREGYLEGLAGTYVMDWVVFDPNHPSTKN